MNTNRYSLYLIFFGINLLVALVTYYASGKYKLAKKILGVPFFMVFLLAVCLFSPQLRAAKDNESDEEVTEIGGAKAIEDFINKYPRKSCFAIGALAGVEQQ